MQLTLLKDAFGNEFELLEQSELATEVRFTGSMLNLLDFAMAMRIPYWIRQNGLVQLYYQGTVYLVSTINHNIQGLPIVHKFEDRVYLSINPVPIVPTVYSCTFHNSSKFYNLDDFIDVGVDLQITVHKDSRLSEGLDFRDKDTVTLVLSLD